MSADLPRPARDLPAPARVFSRLARAIPRPARRRAGRRLCLRLGAALAALGVLAAAAPAPASATSRPRAVVLPFAEVGPVPEGTGRQLAAAIAAELERGGRVLVVADVTDDPELIVRGTVRATPGGRLAADVRLFTPAAEEPRPSPALRAVLAAVRAALAPRA